MIWNTSDRMVKIMGMNTHTKRPAFPIFAMLFDEYRNLSIGSITRVRRNYTKKQLRKKSRPICLKEKWVEMLRMGNSEGAKRAYYSTRLLAGNKPQE